MFKFLPDRLQKMSNFVLLACRRALHKSLKFDKMKITTNNYGTMTEKFGRLPNQIKKIIRKLSLSEGEQPFDNESRLRSSSSSIDPEREAEYNSVNNVRTSEEKLNLPNPEKQDEQPDQQKQDLKLEEFKNRFVEYNGIQYSLSAKIGSPFYAYDDKFKSFFPSPEEIREVIQHLVKSGSLDEDQAKQIMEEYETADSERKFPKIRYVQGTSEILYVTFTEGYGREEKQYLLESSGCCYEIDSFTNRNQSPNNLTDTDTITPVDSSTVMYVLQKIRERMGNDEYQEILKFYKKL